MIMILTIKCVADIQYKKKKSFVVEFNLEILADNLTDFGLTNIIFMHRKSTLKRLDRTHGIIIAVKEREDVFLVLRESGKSQDAEVFCVCPFSTGLLNLEVLLRQFLISKETLSVRMLDESQDPTSLLKEIRDDKTATIIVDANATMSHVILERVNILFIGYIIFLENLKKILIKKKICALYLS